MQNVISADVRSISTQTPTWTTSIHPAGAPPAAPFLVIEDLEALPEQAVALFTVCVNAAPPSADLFRTVHQLSA